MMNRRKNNDLHILIIIIVIIIILVLFVATLGGIGPGSIAKIAEEYKDSKEEAKQKHKRLEEHIKNQEALKAKLAKIFKRVYFGVRLGLVIIWFGIMSILVGFGLIKDLSDFLNYSEASILIFVVMNFITFGTITNLKNFIDLIKTKTENLIYGKHIKIDAKIEEYKDELKKLDDDINNKI
jgi:hypothetical protein